MRRRSAALGVAAAALLGLAACDEGGSPVVEDPGVASSTTAPSATTAPGDTGTQPALWPAPGLVVFASPQDAAADFVEQVLGAGEIGDFRQGDATSGEVDVVFGGEGGGQSIVRSTLLLRSFGAELGWFVIAATNPNAAVTAPGAGATVPAGPLTVEGVGRGFEGAVVVRALRAGTTEVLAEVPTQGGAQADPAPFSVQLDLGGAQPGDVVVLLVQGGVGLETDPGDVGAIPVVVG